METYEVIHKGNLLTATMNVMNNSNPNDRRKSREMIIGDTAVFQVRLVCTMFHIMQPCFNLLFVRFKKQRHVDENLTYKIFVKSAELEIEGMTLSSNDYTWHLIFETMKPHFKFTISAELRLQPSPSTFAPLLDDEGQMDFELRGEDGSVRVHRAVLAAASPMLRSMLSGAWRETAEGVVDVAGTSKDTLEAFKNFVYSRVMPESGLEQLLLLSRFYAMPELERLCVDKLVLGMTAENLCDLIEFACLNKMKQLLITVLECVQSGAVNIMEVRRHMERSKLPPKPEPEPEPEPEPKPEPELEPQQPEQS